MQRIIKTAAAAAMVAAAGTCLAQTDSFHLSQVQMAIGGVNGDATKQAIQTRMRFSFENLYSNVVIRAWDAAGQNPVVVADGMSTLPNAMAGDTVLITTPEFDASTTPACVPDFHMTNPIPASYLAAGRLTFEDHFGTVLWSLAWGGAAYTGPTTGSFTNNPTGQFGPPFAGPLPSAATQALAFQGPASASGGANATDYALTTGAAVFTNNARATFTVSGGPAPCYANCDGSTGTPVLNVNDFICFQNTFAAGDSYANCDGSTGTPMLNVNDFICFQNKFAAGCP
jgi:hypothetical protein